MIDRAIVLHDVAWIFIPVVNDKREEERVGQREERVDIHSIRAAQQVLGMPEHANDMPTANLVASFAMILEICVTIACFNSCEPCQYSSSSKYQMLLLLGTHSLTALFALCKEHREVTKSY